MKALTTVSAIGTHFVLGIIRLIEGIIVTIIWIVGIALILAKLAVHRFWNLFAEGYKETWNSYYSQMGKPQCEICGQTKTKDRIVVYHTCCEKWAHDDCHISEKVAMAIHSHDIRTAAPMMALAREGEVPFSLPIMVKSLRALRNNPYSVRIFADIALVKRIARSMSVREAKIMMMAEFL